MGGDVAVCQSAVSSRQSAVDSRQSAVGSLSVYQSLVGGELLDVDDDVADA